jgi:hypothetical protein
MKFADGSDAVPGIECASVALAAWNVKCLKSAAVCVAAKVL